MPDIKLIGRKILVRKCVTGDPNSQDDTGSALLNGVAIPEKSHDTQYWCEILDVSDQCRLFTKDMIGKAFVRLAEWKPGFQFRISKEDFIVKESLFEVSDAQGGLPAYIIWE